MTGPAQLVAITEPEREARAHRRGRLTSRSGASLHAELDTVHAIYHAMGVAKVARQFPRMVPAGKDERGMLWRLGGGRNEVDYVGSVRIFSTWHPVAFDLKATRDASTFRYPENLRHQLDTLLAWRDRGAIAFLLICDTVLDRAYLVDEPSAWKDLRAGHAIRLREKIDHEGRRTRGDGRAWGSLWPSVDRPLLHGQTTPGWDWRQALEQRDPRFAPTSPYRSVEP